MNKSSYVASAAFSGLEVDFKKLCDDALLGIDGTKTTEINKIYYAIETIKDTKEYEKVNNFMIY